MSERDEKTRDSVFATVVSAEPPAEPDASSLQQANAKISTFCRGVVKTTTSYSEGWREVCQRLLDIEEQRDELLAAAKEIAGFAVSWQPLTPGDISSLRAAIAKAEGR